MFYENAEHARNLQLWYIMHGLLRNEDCILASSESPQKTRAFLINHNFNVDYFEKELRLLHIRQVRDPRGHRDGVEQGTREELETMLSGISHPVRIVAAAVSEIITEDQCMFNLNDESSAHNAFLGDVEENSPLSIWKDFNGSMMCHYAIGENSARYYRDWKKKCTSHHDVALYVPRDGRVRFARPFKSTRN